MDALPSRPPHEGPNTDTDPSNDPSQYLIPAAASLHERRPRTLKHGDTFAVFDHAGDCIADPDNPEGVYHRDCRHLSHLYLTINGGMRPILLSSSLRDDNALLRCDLTNPDLFDAQGGPGLANDRIHILRHRFLWRDSVYERLTVTNYDEAAQTIPLELTFAADFADLFEVRGARRERRGVQRAPEVSTDRVRLSYRGLDDQDRVTVLRFEPAPAQLDGRQARFRFELAPHASTTIHVEIDCADRAGDGSLEERYVAAYGEAEGYLRTSAARAAAISSSNESFNQSVRRCVADTYMLITETEHGPYPYAGIPWFSTVFGRDALITGMETLWMDPEISRGVLSYLAAHQATGFDAAADAEPGKILHEVRRGEMALLGEVPFRHYYGSIDSTPLFVMLAGEYLARTRDRDVVERLWPNIAAALEWIDTYGDRDGDGYVEYGRHTDEGLVNQGWKDSNDSVFHADGRLASGPIALSEVQAYVHGAWHAAAEILTVLDQPREAAGYRARAEDLKQRFDRDFFDAELGTYVLALDGEKQPCRVRSSNAGHVLFTGLAMPEHAACVVRTLMDPSSFSGWGIRTIAATESRYNPMSYHNGSVWPHENALIAAGFARYGFRQEAAAVFEGLLAASAYVDLRRLPELFCGFPRRPTQGPTFYPVSCIPQAWSAAAPLSMVQTCLGLDFDIDTNCIVFNQPQLPGFLDEVTLHGVKTSQGAADIALRRSGDKVVVDLVERRGDIGIVCRI